LTQKDKILKTLQEIKHSYPDITIVGIFGSYARNDFQADSDVDILYEVSYDFHQKYIGFQAINKLEEIRTDIESKLEKSVDFIDINVARKNKYNIGDIEHV
jgi:uncharacterized protein